MLLEPPKLHTLHVMESTLIDLSAWQFLRCTQKRHIDAAHAVKASGLLRHAAGGMTPKPRSTTCTRRLSGLSHYIYVIIDRSVYGMSHGDDILTIKRKISRDSTVQTAQKVCSPISSRSTCKIKSPQSLNQHRDSTVSGFGLEALYEETASFKMVRF